jgi:hemerythrin-like domain-containing protein
MNAIDLLEEDHDVVDALFKRVEDTPPSRHGPIFKRIKNELDTHAHLEEKIFYPTLIENGKKELVDITAEGIEEHAQIKKFLKEIERATAKDKIEAKLKVLIEDTRHHVQEEENEMFPLVRDQFTNDALDALGQRMETERARFQKARKIPPRPPAPKGALEQVLEVVKETAAALTDSDEKPKGPRKPSKTAPKQKSG